MKVPSIKMFSESNVLKKIGKKAKTEVIATSVATAPVGVTSCSSAMYVTRSVPYGTVITHTPSAVIVPGATYYNPAWSLGYWMGYHSAPKVVVRPAPRPAPRPIPHHHR